MKYSPFRHLGSVFWKKDPIQLTVFLTSRCNAKCPFCFYLSSGRQSDEQDELSLAEYKKISSSLGNLLWLAFSGGEIFLRNDLVEITRLFYQQNKPAIILLPTNGLLPEKIYRNTKAILKSCPNSIVTVKLSMDGPEETHDHLRGVKGAYNKMLFCYQTLAPLLDKYSNFELGINTVFCATNQDNITETIQLVGGLEKIRTHTISLIRGKVGDDNLKKVDLDKYKEASKLLEFNLRKNKAARYGFWGGGLKAAQDIIQRRLIYETSSQDRQLVPCQAGRLTAVITETGDVYPCESFADKLGNVRQADYNIRQILNNKKGNAVKASIKNGKCYCTHECYMMMNILFNPGQYPKLFREYAQLKAGSFRRSPSTSPLPEDAF
jgi:radical SAM protein with 4Fe4S-binding SPASM domain